MTRLHTLLDICRCAPGRRRATALGIDGESLSMLQRDLPQWDIEALSATEGWSCIRSETTQHTDLLILGADIQKVESSALCRAIRSRAGHVDTPLVVLVSSGDEDELVNAVLDAGANGCLVLPVHIKNLVNLLHRAREGNRPGRHTLGLQRAQCDDPWRDEGGES